jgi:hypothetical protein
MTMPSAHAAVKDAPRRFAVPPTVGILDSRFAAGRIAFMAKGRRAAPTPRDCATT